MKKHKFMKEEQKKNVVLTTEELTAKFMKNKMPKRTIFFVGLLVCAVTFTVFFVNSAKNLQTVTLNVDDFEFNSAPVAATSMKKDVIAIPSGIVKANPFLPYRTLGNEVNVINLVNDVPKYDLIAPPELDEKGMETAKIMETVVSGILFDKYSPSAILKIDGSDYLVKKGDTVHNYKVVNIAQNSVTVQFGKNTYQAGIGELLTDGSVKYNEVSNLSKKFGGEK